MLFTIVSTIALIIRYSGGHVFAALTNGTLEIFSRNIAGEWDWDNHASVLLGQRRDFPVLCLLPTNNKIWAGISHTVKILNDITHKEEYSIQVPHTNSNVLILCIVIHIFMRKCYIHFCC